jgi:hypothetical protein
MGSQVLFVRNDGIFSVDRHFVGTQNGSGFSQNWTHVVAVGPHILFVRNDGLWAIDHIDESNGKRVETQSGSGFSQNWTHVVAVA